jgi:hypothetical protein
MMNHQLSLTSGSGSMNFEYPEGIRREDMEDFITWMELIKRQMVRRMEQNEENDKRLRGESEENRKRYEVRNK